MERTKIRSKTKGIERAIQEYLEKKAIEDLIALSGQIHIDLDWRKEEERELNDFKIACTPQSGLIQDLNRIRDRGNGRSISRVNRGVGEGGQVKPKAVKRRLDNDC